MQHTIPWTCYAGILSEHTGVHWLKLICAVSWYTAGMLCSSSKAWNSICCPLETSKTVSAGCWKVSFRSQCLHCTNGMMMSSRCFLFGWHSSHASHIRKALGGRLMIDQLQWQELSFMVLQRTAVVCCFSITDPYPLGSLEQNDPCLVLIQHQLEGSLAFQLQLWCQVGTLPSRSQLLWLLNFLSSSWTLSLKNRLPRF